jgi:hypothetical protein
MPSQRTRRHAVAFGLALLAAGAVIFALTSTSRAATDAPGTNCGGTLWRLMTLSDRGRHLVNLHGERTTIAKIAALRTPRRIVPARTTAFQRQAWSMRTVVDRYRIASNGEIVLTLYSIESAQYMNAYLASPTCLGPRARP